MKTAEVQRRLWEQSHEHKRSRETAGTLFAENFLKQRVRNLHDLMHHPLWLKVACDKVLKSSRNKASGVDKQTVHKFRRNYCDNLESLRLEVKHRTYQPQPARRQMIEKDNGKMRPLGIPCLRDKIVQEAMRMALEPIFEVEFHQHSYGFRPHRSMHHAIFQCRQLLGRNYSWVIEGDVKSCFDEISHKSILRNLREKIQDNKFLELVNRFLKAGVQIDGKVLPTIKGVPQGGVLSPLLANIVLNKLDWFLHAKGDHHAGGHQAWRQGQPNVRFVRYADDWCVFITRGKKRYAELLREDIRQFLKREANLELSAEKTHVTHIRDGFDFLGLSLICEIGQKGNVVPKIKIGKKPLRRIKQRLTEAMRHCPQQESIAVRLQRANRIIQGWTNHYCIAHNLSRYAGGLDGHALWTAVKAACRKFDITTGQCFKRYYRNSRFTVSEDLVLESFAGVPMNMNYRNPEEYVPGEAVYLEDDELDPPRPICEHGRPGSGDLKQEALQRDGYRCKLCGKTVTWQTAQADHIMPVRRFDNLSPAHKLENIQILCKGCHKQKTREELVV